MGTSGKTVIQCPTQDADIGAVKTEPFHHHKDLSCPFIGMPPPPTPSSHPTQVLGPGNHSSVLPLYNFVISRMLYKWNHIVCNLWGLSFSTQHTSPEIQPTCPMDQMCSFLLLSIIPWYRCPTVWLTINTLKSTSVVSNLGLLGIKQS